MQPDNFERAVRGGIRFRGAAGQCARGDVQRLRALFGEEVARAQWRYLAALYGHDNPPAPNVPWW